MCTTNFVMIYLKITIQMISTGIGGFIVFCHTLKIYVIPYIPDMLMSQCIFKAQIVVLCVNKTIATGINISLVY